MENFSNNKVTKIDYFINLVLFWFLLFLIGKITHLSGLGLEVLIQAILLEVYQKSLKTSP